jgi:hypothetical protein
MTEVPCSIFWKDFVEKPNLSQLLCLRILNENAPRCKALRAKLAFLRRQREKKRKSSGKKQRKTGEIALLTFIE